MNGWPSIFTVTPCGDFSAVTSAARSGAEKARDAIDAAKRMLRVFISLMQVRGRGISTIIAAAVDNCND